MVLDRFFRLSFYTFVNFEFFDSVSVSISRSLSLSRERARVRVRAATTYDVVLLPFRRR